MKTSLCRQNEFKCQSDNSQRWAFTLVEVAFSMAIIVTAVVTVMLLLAGTQKSQQRARMGMYAAMIASHAMTRFAQTDTDFRGAQTSPNNTLTRMIAASKSEHSGNVLWVETASDERNIVTNYLENPRGAMFTTAGEFNLENRLLAEGLLVPIPEVIARRLDSPGNEIGRLLDSGGTLYYIDPNQSDGLIMGSVAKGSGNREAGAELNRMIIGIMGAAQQNTLPFNPAANPQTMMYPFPPQAYAPSGGKANIYPRRWKIVDGRLRNLEVDAQDSLPEWDVSSGSFIAGNLTAEDNHWWNTGKQGTSAIAQGASWLEQSYIDRIAGMSTSASAANFSPWLAGEAEFWRLVDAHYARIVHQLRQYQYTTGSTTTTILVPDNDPANFVEREVLQRFTRVDRLRQNITEERMVTIREHNGAMKEEERTNSTSFYARGVPSPPIGLPMARGQRGTDILYEDAETLASDRWNQMRVGLPGLERRVMYRTASLALWGKVDGHGTITEVGLDELDNMALTGSPNVIKSGSLPDSRNPLLTIIDPPTDPRDIHPAQVLALSYIAHAAIMVTGYKPPFINEKNSIDPLVHEDLVPDENAPYKDPDGEEYYLFNPFYINNASVDAASAELPTAEVPASFDVNVSVPGTHQVLKVGVVPPDDPRISRYMDGTPITYRRYAPGATVRNPFPGPYADRGAFGWRGEQRFARNSTTLWITSHGSLAAGDLTDTEMARNAMETALRWAMAYTREFPYCMIVPKPANAPTMVDRPLFAWSHFNNANAARRPSTPASDSHFFPVVWGDTNARWPVLITTSPRMTSFESYRSADFDPAGSGRSNPLFTNVEMGVPDVDARYLNPTVLGGLSQRVRTNSGGRNQSHSILGATSAQSHMRVKAYFYNADNPYQINLSAPWHTAAAGSPVATPDQIATFRMNESPHADQWWYNRPFEVADRTRQMVFWAVDWKSYEDAESAPSETIDYSFFASGGPLDLNRHPEHNLMWANPARDATHSQPPLDRVSWQRRRTNDGNHFRWVDTRVDVLGSGLDFTNIMYSPNDGGELPWSTFGSWGADRNGNGVWDRGPVPSSSRMMAVEVARFPFYDPVMWVHTGN